MKQHITKEQWDELKEVQKDTILAEMLFPNPDLRDTDSPNIGQMIEFLGDDLVGFWRGEEGHGWEVDVYINLIDIKKELPKEFRSDEMCDALWEAVKQKLK